MVNTEQAIPLPETQRTDIVPRQRWSEWWIELLIRGAGISVILIIGLIFLFLLWEGLPAYEGRYRKDPRRWTWLADTPAPSLSAMNGPRDGRVLDVGYTVGEFIVERWGTRAFADLIDRGGRVQDALGLSQARFEEE